MFSRKQLVSLIVPLIGGTGILGTIGIADMLMVSTGGRSGDIRISLVNSINMSVPSVFSALAAGGSILCIQYLGKGDDKMRIPLLSSFDPFSYISSDLRIMLLCWESVPSEKYFWKCRATGTQGGSDIFLFIGTCISLYYPV